ncbi:MAG: hypothetical protein R2911_19370 [Caldilineaceae bacterium]
MNPLVKYAVIPNRRLKSGGCYGNLLKQVRYGAQQGFSLFPVPAADFYRLPA